MPRRQVSGDIDQRGTMKQGELIHVAGPVYLLIAQNKGYFPFSHSIVIKSRGETAIIDTGAGIDVLQPWADKVDLVLNSHTHPDHVPCNWLFEGKEIMVPRQSWESSGLKDKLAPRLVEGPEVVQAWKDMVTNHINFRDRRPDTWFEPGQIIEVGAARLEAVHTPGHTADHYCFWLEDEGLLISADIDFTPFGPWYGNPESDIRQFRRSLDKCRELKPKIMVSSHFKPVDAEINARLAKFEAVIDQRNDKIAAMLERPKTLAQLVDEAPIYGSHPYEPLILRFFESQMIAKHLDELVRQGRAKQDGETYSAIP